MTPRVTLSAPCTALWVDMSPTSNGRHCTACEKTVVDFTRLSDSELLVALHEAGKVCGRFRPDQVTAPTKRPAHLRGNWAAWVAAAAVALSSCDMPDALKLQLRTTPVVVEGQQVVVQGLVLDKTDGKPLPGALIISLSDSAYNTRTDSTGRFTLKLPLHMRDSLLYAVGQTSPQGYMQGYIGRRFQPAQAMEIRLRPDPNYGMLGEPDPVALELGEGRPPQRLMAPPPPPPKSGTIRFTPPQPLTADSVTVDAAD